MVKFIRRVGPSNRWCTRGEVYKFYRKTGFPHDPNWYTISDQGRELSPQWRMKEYWEVVEDDTCPEPLINNEPEVALGGRMIKVKPISYITVNDKKIDTLDPPEPLDVVIREKARIRVIAIRLTFSRSLNGEK